MEDLVTNTKKQVVTPLSSIRELIYRLLLNQEMTMIELVDCLMSEPYNVPHTSISLVPIALDSLNNANWLGVKFRIDKQNSLALEVVFSAIS